MACTAISTLKVKYLQSSENIFFASLVGKVTRSSTTRKQNTSSFLCAYNYLFAQVSRVLLQLLSGFNITPSLYTCMLPDSKGQY